MQMMANIIGVTHIFADEVRKFNYFSILQKGKGVDSHTSPPLPSNLGIPPLVKILDHPLNAWNRLLIMSKKFQY